ncbi:MAG: Kae1-associated kinase Bud32 [Candidatus Thorarchaeota archaeon]|nr:MAG: Kae1-associated kinase Bud32 [Candidatus Thorarchaeota archaeon]
MSEIWALGAESVITRTERWGRPLIVKTRVKKPYLHPEIDEALRRQRTARECRMLSFARRLGVPTPAVYAVDRSTYSITMDLIDGKQLKEFANDMPDSRLETMCFEFGRLLGLLHRGKVVHGDPTTSNVIVDNRGKLWIVDFGLAEWNATIEMMGVDLHLVRRALETTHWDRQTLMLKATIEGYSSIMGNETEEVLSRMDEIRERGRYH